MAREVVPNDVFRPGKIPIEENNVYSPRGKKEEDFRKFISRGWIPIVYGEYGVGKTSLAQHVLKPHHDNGTLVNIESVDGKDFESVIKQILEKIGYTTTTKVVTGETSLRSIEATGKAPIKWFEFSAKTNSSIGKNRSIEEQFVVQSPTESKVFELAEANGIALILDELHKASKDFRRALVSFIKAYSNANCSKFKIILLGTSSDASDLVDMDEGVDRIVSEVHLASMTNEEADYLITTGMRILNIDLPNDIKNTVIRYSVGSPNILQFLCLEIAEKSFSRESRLVRYIDIQEAVKDFIESKENRLYKKYTSAIENTGPRRYRKLILTAMSESDDEYVTMDYITAKISEILGEQVPSQSLSGPLRSLKLEEHGSILKDVETGTGRRVQNLTTFKDPAMKSFIRLISMKDDLV